MGKKQTDEFLDWLALGGEEGQETFKHQMGRHNQQRHGWRYGDNLDGDANREFASEQNHRMRHSGLSIAERADYRRAPYPPAFRRGGIRRKCV